MKFTTTFLTLALAFPVCAQTGVTVKTILNNGPVQNRYDVVILGDGYKSTEQTKFNADALKFTNALFNKQPYKTFKQFFNVHTVFRASTDSGASHPDKSPPIVKNTAYGSSYNTGGTARCLYIKNSSQGLKDAAQAPATEGRVVVIVNDSRYGGCASTFAVSYNGSSMNEVQIHEVGHSFGLLADEYDYPNNTYTGGEPGQVNVTKDSKGTKWKHWHGVRSVLAYEGARYYKKGIYRPAPNCLMRSLGRALCPVCEEQIVKRAYVTVNSIDGVTPAAATVNLKISEKKTFSFNNISPTASASVITWTLDSKVIQNGSSSLIFDASKYTTGMHSLTVTSQDKTAFVRSDPGLLLKNSHTWRVDISGQPIPDLTMPYLTLTPASSKPNAKIEITSVVQNKGFATATNVKVQYVISTDTKLSADDKYLNFYTVASLAGKDDVHLDVSKNVEIPPHLAPGTYYVGAIADPDGTITELSETNNIAFSTLVLSKGDCYAKMSYRDVKLWPVYSGTGSGVTGGTLLPTVSAPCNAGNGYVIIWGFSGTSPGFPIGGLTVPLNWDTWSSISYGMINGPNMIAFRGTLDANGIGKATLKFIPKSYKGTATGHLVAVLWDTKTLGFTKISQPLEIVVKP